MRQSLTVSCSDLVEDGSPGLAIVAIVLQRGATAAQFREDIFGGN